MVNEKKVFLFGLLFLSSVFFASFVLAETNNSFNPTNLDDLLEKIPEINSALQEEKIEVPSQIYSFVGSGNILIEIQRKKLIEGTVLESFYIVLDNKSVAGIYNGAIEDYNYKVSLSEDTINDLLRSSEGSDSILNKIKEDEIKITAKGFFNKIKLFFAKLFI